MRKGDEVPNRTRLNLTNCKAYHHPEQLRPEHDWVDFFSEFDRSDQRQNGLEFVEGLWADKLAAVAVIATIAIIVVSIVWCVLGGDLQTVFTVMSFVLTLIAGKFYPEDERAIT